MTHPFFAKAAHPRVFAHRGLASAPDATGEVWENTAAAFAAAHAVGVEYIETDCRVTADGDVILIHDATLNRLLNDERRVDEVRTVELRELYAAHGGLLTVSEMLDAFPETRFNIDVKTDAAAAPLGTVIAPHAHRVLLTSFSDRRRNRAIQATLDAGAALRPAASAGQSRIIALRLLSALRTAPVQAFRGLDALQIPERFGRVRVLTPALLRAAQRHAVEVHVWTVNDESDMTRIVAAGVDGIITDRADLAVRALH